MGYCMVCDSGLPEGAVSCHQCGVLLPDLRPAAPPAPPSMGIAVAALVLNLIIWPGLGSIIAGRGVGWVQGFGFLLSVILTLILIGFPMMLAFWIWGLVTGVELINAASAAQRQALAVPPEGDPANTGFAR